MRSTYKQLYYINRSKIKADGTTSIMCRVTIDGKAIVLATGLYCTLNEWNSKKGETKNSRINGMLNDYKNRIDDTYNSLLKTNGVITAELLKNAITGVSDIPKYILQAGEIERENLKIRSVQIDSTSSYRGSKMYQHYLREYINSLGKEDMLFTDITEEFGNNFVLYMKMNYPHKPSYRNHCLCWLKRLVYLAVDNGILRFNPIEDVQYEKKPPKKLMYISKGQLQDIMNHPKLDPLQELARRTFVFSCFCGLAYVDVQRLYPHHIGTTADGRKYIRTYRKKTDVEAFIPLHPIAEQILSLYNTTDDSKPIFSLPCRDMIWFEIHELGFSHQFKHNLSYHQSRHTAATTVFLSNGVPIETVSSMLGHKSIKTTQIYAKITKEKLNQDMENLAARLNGIEEFAGCTI